MADGRRVGEPGDTDAPDEVITGAPSEAGAVFPIGDQDFHGGWISWAEAADVINEPALTMIRRYHAGDGGEG